MTGRLETPFTGHRRFWGVLGILLWIDTPAKEKPRNHRKRVWALPFKAFVPCLSRRGAALHKSLINTAKIAKLPLCPGNPSIEPKSGVGP